MKKEYLPIGSVCTLHKNNMKVMVIGYLSIDYTNNIKMFTYSAVPYPVGTTANSTRYSFNDEDVKTIDFVGFKDESYNKLNEQLLKVKTDEIITEVDQNEELQKALKFQFDENGFVVSEGNRINIDNAPVSNPFNDYKQTSETQKEEPIDVNNWPIFNGFQFDENGTVVKEIKNEEQSKNYEFDDAGIVVGTKEPKSKATSQFQFDEDGFVIDSNTPTASESPVEKPSNSDYQFDENGFVIDLNTPTTSESPVETLSVDNIDNTYRFDESGTVIDVHDKNTEKQGYIFDENGFVVKAD